MRCPNCGVEAPDDVWNCPSCRMNLYWATRHYDGLVALRGEQGRSEHAASPPFLVAAHRDAMEERATHGPVPDNKVRIAARKVIRRAQEPAPEP